MNNNRRYLVFGGTGSLGQQLVLHLINDKKANPKNITIVSRDEQKQVHMQRTKEFVDCKYITHDIRDRDGIYDIVKGNDVVINCAAMKHIFKVEDDVLEGIKTNVVGVHNILKSIKRCDRPVVFVNISSDKAPEATTMYGATKFLGEGLVRNFADSDPIHDYYSVRYGNVIGSKGSFIPKVIDLAKRNESIVITDPRMTRFMMHMDDSIKLIFLAIECSAPSGAVLIPLHLKSCYIAELAKEIVRQLGSDSRIDGIDDLKCGTFKGEKFNEVILSQTEEYDNNVHNLHIASKHGTPFGYIYERHWNERDGEAINFVSNSPKCLMSKQELEDMVSNILNNEIHISSI